ncbi:MAG: hypothetical protein IPN59_04170 [Holophaga sp.]|nr:hypothetical protein [Holophaga sp.]
MLNDISAGKGFGHQANTLIPVTAQGGGTPIGPMPKDQLAQAVVVWLGSFLKGRV